MARVASLGAVRLTKEGYAGLAIENRFGLDLYSTLDTTTGIEGYAHDVTNLLPSRPSAQSPG